MNGWKADVLIDARLLGYRRGGITRYVSELTSILPEVAPDLDIVPFVNRMNIRIPETAARVFTPPHHRFERPALGSELSIRFPKLIHSPDFIAPASVGPRRVVTIHDLTFLTHPEYLSLDSRRYYGQIFQSLKAADKVIAVSKYTAGELVKQTGIDPGKVVPILNGADGTHSLPDHESARQTIRSKLDSVTCDSLLSDRPIILTVGTVEPRKRQEILVKAMDHPDLTGLDLKPVLLLVGQRGWAADEIVESIKIGAERGDVIWLESVDDELLSALYCQADVFVLASADEGFGLPVIEAMRADVPVIAAAKGALPEVAGDAAALISSDEPEEWGMTIACLMKTPECRAVLRQKGRKRATEFTWERTARQTANVYREVLGR